MSIVNLIILASLFISSVLSEYNVDTIAFPIVKNISFDFLKSLKKNHSIEYDIERSRKFSSAFLHKQNHRLVNYDRIYDADGEEIESNPHLISLDFLGLVEKQNCSKNCFDEGTQAYKYNYTAEEHYVETEDGYNLTLHRISGSPNHPKKEGKEIVYIQHGLFLSSDAYVTRGPKYDLAFMLADWGYDVWLGNARGNSYSRSHRDHEINSTEFWDFSFHEIGVYDVRAFIDYVLNETNMHYLVYIGYSIGATESYVLLSEYPEYNEKLRVLISISPFAFWNSPTKDDLNVTEVINKIKAFQPESGSVEMYPQSSLIEYIGFSNCGLNYNVCRDILSSFFGSLYYQLDYLDMLNAMRYVPAGTSAKTLLHLLQLIKSGKLEHYDLYDCNCQDTYNLTKVTAPNAIFVGGVEHFLYDKNITTLIDQFSNVAVHKVRSNLHGYFESYAHELDFPWGIHINDINAAIVGLLRRF